MPEINNYEVYTTRMQKSVYDKMFFVDKIFDENIDTFIDFGCADAELICHLRVFMPDVRFIGYDIDDNMLAKARRKAPFAEFYSNWDDIKVDPKRTIVNLSSVLHEIYHYCARGGIEQFWNRLLTPGFAYITIRDMFKPTALPCGTMWRQSVYDAGYGDKLHDFENHWGPINDTVSMIHFLLKYKYTENWERELHENYLPLAPAALGKHFKDYETVYERFDALPYIVHQVSKDFGLDVSYIPTHLHLILRKGSA